MKKIIQSIFSLILVLILTLTPIQIAFANENTENSSKTEFTEDLAIEMGERFICSMEPSKNIVAYNPIKFYDESGQAIGYIVNFYNDDMPYGYVIFDTTSSDLITEYSLGFKFKNPYESICDNLENDITNYSGDLSSEKIYKLSSFTYGIQDSSGKMQTNYGSSLDAPTTLIQKKPEVKILPHGKKL